MDSRSRGASEQRRTIRCLNWRSDGSFSRSASSGCPTRTTLTSFAVSVSRFASSRISSNSSWVRLCASSTMRAVTPPACAARGGRARRPAGTAPSSRRRRGGRTCRRESRRSPRASASGWSGRRAGGLRAPLGVQRRAKQRGLAGAGLAEEQRDAQRRGEPVAEGGERLAVTGFRKRNRGFGVSWNGRSRNPKNASYIPGDSDVASPRQSQVEGLTCSGRTRPWNRGWASPNAIMGHYRS